MKNLPRKIVKYNGKKETELQLIKNVIKYDFELGNLLKDALKKENQLNRELKNIPF